MTPEAEVYLPPYRQDYILLKPPELSVSSPDKAVKNIAYFIRRHLY